jgi:hypothetical protein
VVVGAVVGALLGCNPVSLNDVSGGEVGAKRISIFRAIGSIALRPTLLAASTESAARFAIERIEQLPFAALCAAGGVVRDADQKDWPPSSAAHPVYLGFARRALGIWDAACDGESGQGFLFTAARAAFHEFVSRTTNVPGHLPGATC